VILRDARCSRWDGTLTKVLAGIERLERAVAPGEVGVFEPTGAVVEVEEVERLRGGDRMKLVGAREFRRVRTRLVSLPKPRP
jgi:hypothetical protein